MKVWMKITYGIPPQAKEPKDIREMRQIIDRVGWDCMLIRNAQNTSRSMGLSGEDEYVLLAYNALRELHRMTELNNKFLMAQPLAPIVMPVGTLKP